jgi:hypothetical protein
MINYVTIVIVRYVMKRRKRIFIKVIRAGIPENPVAKTSAIAMRSAASLLISNALRLFPFAGRSRGIESPCTPQPMQACCLRFATLSSKMRTTRFMHI